MTQNSPFQSGPRLIDGDALNSAFATPSVSFQGPLTALAGGGRTGAPTLTNTLTEFDTVATNADSCQLPSAQPGQIKFIGNAGAHTLQVFANGSDTINGVAGATGVAMTTTQNAVAFCAEKGKWRMIIV